jgi:hypothetical protein
MATKIKFKNPIAEPDITPLVTGTTIKFKLSTVATKVPLAADLQIGEIAVNSADGKVYMKLNDNTIKVLLG